MNLAMETYELAKRFGDANAFSMIKEAGFDGIDYSFYWLTQAQKEAVFGEHYKAYAQELRAQLDALGLTCRQAHAPFDFKIETDILDLSNENYRNLIKSIEIAAILGAEHIIVHSVAPARGETALETNTRYYRSFLPYLKQYNIRLAVENLGPRFYTPESLKEMLAQLNPAWYVACIDVGHASVKGIDPWEFIKAFDKNTLKALHIQDTDYQSDCHWLPYAGKIDWDKTMESLKNIGYNGDLTLEIFLFLQGIDDALIPPVLSLAAKTGRHLIKKMNS